MAPEKLDGRSLRCSQMPHRTEMQLRARRMPLAERSAAPPLDSDEHCTATEAGFDRWTAVAVAIG